MQMKNMSFCMILSTQNGEVTGTSSLTIASNNDYMEYGPSNNIIPWMAVNM